MTSFWQTASETPERIAVAVDGGQQVTYGELAELVNRLSHGLRDLGLEADDVVAVALSNRFEFLALQLATQQLGLVLAPINRHLTGPEIGYILGDSGARVLVADDTSAAAAVAAADSVGLPAAVRFGVGDVPGFRPLAELQGDPSRPEGRTAGSLMLFSSGTTGKPKGIRKPRSGLDPEVEQETAGLRLAQVGMTEGGVYLAVGPLYHAAPNGQSIAALYLGHTVVLSSGFDPRHALDLITRYGVTDSFLVPTMLHRLLTVPAEERSRYDVSSVRNVLLAGAICPVETKRLMIEWWGPVFLEYYGASESGMVTVIDSADWLAHPGSVGRAKPGTDVRVCDPEGRPLPVGEVGLVHLRSGTTFEYHGDPAKTAASHQDGYFIPGDLGRLDEDGYLYLADRRSDLIISGGVNIYPAEIEAEIMQHPGVLDTVAFGVPDPEWGQRVVALVEPRLGVADRAGLPDSVGEHCRGRLAGFKIPRVIEVVDELPRTAAGKIARGRVREEYQRTLTAG